MPFPFAFTWLNASQAAVIHSHIFGLYFSQPILLSLTCSFCSGSRDSVCTCVTGLALLGLSLNQPWCVPYCLGSPCRYMASIWFSLILYSIIDIHVFLVVIQFGCIYMKSSNSSGLFLDRKFCWVHSHFPLSPRYMRCCTRMFLPCIYK